MPEANSRLAPAGSLRSSRHTSGPALRQPPRRQSPRRDRSTLRKLGQGRSAEVFVDDANGQPIARKVFTGETSANLVLHLLTGSPNPYTWCESAIRSAVARRRIVSHLVDHWFGGELRLPRTEGWRWNFEHRAYELATELIEGRHVPLRGPDGGLDGDPVGDLVHRVMKPLQEHLEEAGFDGLVWQAGRGNPVALNNFMLEDDDPHRGEGRRWVWIDLESGVPALFAMNPLATLRFYLPKSLHHRRWLFDDVDVPKLRRYLWRHRDDLERSVGRSAVTEMLSTVDELEKQQRAWKSIPRHRRGIAAELSRGRISAKRAEHYRTRPYRWLGRQLPTGAARGARRLAAAARRGLAKLRRVDLRRSALGAWRFATSQRYRARAARRLVAGRLRQWSDRRFLGPRGLRRLHDQLESSDVSSYLSDFGVHLGVKPFVKAMQWTAVPALLAAGLIDAATAGLAIVAGGLIVRTLYTTGRLLQASFQGQPIPWLAWLVGTLPVVGTAAYPAELVYRSTTKTGELARFILYDALAAVGRAVPIWGGPDSLIEHSLNRLGDVAGRWLARPPTRRFEEPQRGLTPRKRVV